MHPRELKKLGIPAGPAMEAAIMLVTDLAKSKMTKDEMTKAIRDVATNPEAFLEDGRFGKLAAAMDQADPALFAEREALAPYRQWGSGLEQGAIDQMNNACRLPVSVAGALMPDAHQGYGLPIGGVLAAKDAVIPYAVGMDIACRMKLSVLDLPVYTLNNDPDALKSALTRETSFGVGAKFKKRKQHAVMDEDWSVSPITEKDKDKAWSQLGTSGSGNHFVEFGVLSLKEDDLGLEAGKYLALLSHSGSRGTGGDVATLYSKVAKQLHPELPKELSHLAWLDIESQEGQEYWAAMELMGLYAAANHKLIHEAIVKNLGAEVLADVENHHNFAWKETYQGEEVFVHRKGATPAHAGVLGIIPGSMGTPGFVVRGLGLAESLNSASHGAGRKMSRAEAFRRFKWNDVREFLTKQKVTLLSAGLDEAPMAYKDIHEVIKAQADLVMPVARFDPKIVKMSPGKRK